MRQLRIAERLGPEQSGLVGLNLFREELLSDGLVYPCTLDELARWLRQLPELHLQGLRSVGLVSTTRRDRWANGRYYGAPICSIHLFPLPVSMSYRLPAGTRPGEVETGLVVEARYGMRVQRVGARFLCEWAEADWRRFMVEHVLLHEIGHHVFRRLESEPDLRRQFPAVTPSEKFAEWYAERMKRELTPRPQER